MAVLEIDKFIGTDREVKSRIQYIGIEVEGVWKVAPKGSRIVHDGSVKGFPALGLPEENFGEIASPPILPIQATSWILKNYPNFLNETCGLHMHMSFKEARNYMRLMVEDYQDTVLHYLEKWGKEEKIPDNHHFWSRLRGESEYCQKKFWPDKQVIQQRKDYDRTREGHRYTMINYCHGLRGMGTVEIRVLPMFDTPQQSARAIRLLVDVTNGSLIRLGRKEKTIEAEFALTTSSEIYKDQVVSLFR